MPVSCLKADEFKAVFSVTMIVPSALTAFSNMPEMETASLPGGLKRISFMDTPVMSTYLLAFCVGEFDFVQTLTNHGVLVRVYTPPGKAAQGLFSLECAKRSLDYFDDFFRIPYPLPKLDMVAVPEFAMVSLPWCTALRLYLIADDLPLILLGSHGELVGSHYPYVEGQPCV